MFGIKAPCITRNTIGQRHTCGHTFDVQILFRPTEDVVEGQVLSQPFFSCLAPVVVLRNMCRVVPKAMHMRRRDVE